MLINNRKDIRDFIVQIEQRFAVNQWKVQDVHLWPILRIQLYSGLIDYINNKESMVIPLRKKKFLNIVKSLFKKGIYFILWPYFLFRYKSWLGLLEDKSTLFIAHEAHTDVLSDQRVNRFFSPLIEKYKLQSQFSYLEYGLTSKIPLLHDKEMISFSKGFKYLKGSQHFFRKRKISGGLKIEIEGYSDFIEYLRLNEMAPNFTNSYAYPLDSLVLTFNDYLIFANDVLNKIKPNRIFTLCYYWVGIMPLIALANQRKIETIEMQHGPQPDFHLAYGSWSIVPSNGYDMLPRTYWCWDKNSAQTISKWNNGGQIYQAIIGGNPWLNYINIESKKSKDYILYCLQPFTQLHGSFEKSMEMHFPKVLIVLIKELPYTWYVRLHPRQRGEMSQIRDFIREHGIQDKVNIDQATMSPLPQVMNDCIFHITHFSGTTIEAGLMRKHTILINRLGLDAFPEMIANNEATFLDLNDYAFNKEFLTVLNKEMVKAKDKFIDTYSEQIDELFTI